MEKGLISPLLIEVNKFSTPIKDRLLLPVLILKTVCFNIPSKVIDNNKTKNTKPKNNNPKVSHITKKTKKTRSYIT